jgi:prepilin-type N-terminal cleavage/methylation domain-containing protein/prepilin-type processing-associated H-X9-DG protein
VRKRGFTLIELLVVIAIIAILAAILFPVFARTKEKARQSACSSNVKQLCTAFAMYRTDFDGKMPRMAYVDSYGKSVRWIQQIYPSVNNEQLFECPSNEVAKDANDSTRPVTNCSLPETSYLYDLGAVGAGRGVIFGETDVRDSAGTIIMTDGWYFTGINNASAWNYAMFWWQASEAQLAALVNGEPGTGYVVPAVEDRVRRHNDGCNAGYFDGHVKFVKNARPQDFSPEMD